MLQAWWRRSVRWTFVKVWIPFIKTRMCCDWRISRTEVKQRRVCAKLLDKLRKITLNCKMNHVICVSFIWECCMKSLKRGTCECSREKLSELHSCVWRKSTSVSFLLQRLTLNCTEICWSSFYKTVTIFRDRRYFGLPTQCTWGLRCSGRLSSAGR
jgi:hypothetical protein